MNKISRFTFAYVNENHFRSESGLSCSPPLPQRLLAVATPYVSITAATPFVSIAAATSTSIVTGTPYVRSLLLRLHPLTSATSTFAAPLLPQVVNRQVSYVKLVQDKSQMLENYCILCFRSWCQQRSSQLRKLCDMVNRKTMGIHVLVKFPIFSMIIVLSLCEKVRIEGGMVFQLLEDLIKMTTMRNCKDIFGYIESKQGILGKPELFARWKLVMLRTCN